MRIVSLPFLVLALSSSTPVLAASPGAEGSAPPEPASAPPAPISVAPLLGYATSDAGIGVGLRGGYTLASGLHVGGTFVHHFGTTVDGGAIGGQKLESSVRLFYPGVEVGYEIPAGPVKLMPYGGLGVVFVTATTKLGSREESATDSSAALWPGLRVSYDVPRSRMYVGGDTRLVLLAAGGDPSFGVFATGGMRF